MEYHPAMSDFSFQTGLHANFSVNCNCINVVFRCFKVLKIDFAKFLREKLLELLI